MFDIQKFTREILPRYIAGGSPTEDTINHYETEINNFLKWCCDNNYNPLELTENDAYDYLAYLNTNNYSSSSICLKIAAAKTFYSVASKVQLMLHTNMTGNPFNNIKPKRPTVDDTDFDFFSVDDLKEICNSIIKRGEPTALRDLAIVMLMAVEGLRTIEVHRLSDEDINFERNSILIHGKGKNSFIYPCDDTFNVLKNYLDNRPTSVPDDLGTPTFIGYSPKFFGQRISRNGIRWSINHILLAVDKKKKGSSCHTLRHSCGTNLYDQTKDIRLVQETLRHSSPATTSRYAHIKKENRTTSSISPLK